MTHELLLLHAAITWALAGLIWTIQIVHYPLFEQVGEGSFVTYHARHMWLITWVAGPLMLAEVGSAVLLLFLGERPPLFCLSLVPLLAIWGSTFIHQVRLHDKLTNGFHRETIRRLNFTNWIRTIGWTLRAVCLLAALWSAQS
jgi:hypothetical protein